MSLCLYTLRQFAISIHSLLLSVCLLQRYRTIETQMDRQPFYIQQHKMVQSKKSGKETKMQQEAGVRWDAGDPVMFSSHFGGQQCNER